MQPATPALIEEERTITYAELAHRLLRTAGHLAGLGIKQGDLVGICLRDDCEHLIELLAIARLGAVAAEIDWRSRPSERARIGTVLELGFAVVSAGLEFGSCSHAVVDDEWHAAVATATPAGDLPLDWSAPAAVAGSSGSTGLPKFTLANHLQLYLQAAALGELIPTPRRHRFLQTLPLYFTGVWKGCVAALMRGDSLIVHPVLTAPEFVEAVAQFNATGALIVPSMVRQLLQHAEQQQCLFPNIDFLSVVGAPLFPDEKRDALRKLTPRFQEQYGVAAAGPISLLPPSAIPEHPSSVGRPLSLIEVEVVDDNHCPLGPDAVGRLRCRGPGLASPLGEESAKEFHDGWYYPSELASINPEGYIHLKGRTSEVIYRGGAKIFPTEIEAVLQAHDAVTEAAVVAIQSSESENEEVLLAYVTSRREVTVGELIAHCRTHLTAFKIPREIHIVPDLPKNSSGKLDKLALKLFAESR
jgi:acyl-coenzyme A synthetase/AMP-(fatty) acid ligase